jgi:hypothetical protein
MEKFSNNLPYNLGDIMKLKWALEFEIGNEYFDIVLPKKLCFFFAYCTYFYLKNPKISQLL